MFLFPVLLLFLFSHSFSCKKLDLIDKIMYRYLQMNMKQIDMLFLSISVLH